MVLVGNRLDEFGGHDGLHDKLVALHLALRLAVHDDVVKEDHAGLVTIYQNPLALVVLAGHAHAVSVGVGCHHDVGIDALGQVQRHGECLAVFRVRAFYGGEVAVGNHLLGHSVHVVEAPEFERARNEHFARAVQRRVHNLEVVLALDAFGVNAQGVYLVKIDFVNLFANDFDEFGAAFKLDVLHFHLVHLVDDALVVRSEHLCAVVPVGFVAVIFLGVVAGRKDNTALAAQVANGKRHFGRGAHVVEQVNLDAVGREDVGGSFGKEAAVVAAVVTYHHGDLLHVLKVQVKVVSQALRGSAHGVFVHAVGSCAHDAAQTARAEFERAVEGVDEFRFVLILQHGFHGLLGFCVVAGRSHPLLGHLLTLSNECLLVFHTLVFYLYGVSIIVVGIRFTAAVSQSSNRQGR